MSTPVDAERAWADLQRIRVPQERVYDELERCTATGRRAYLPIAAAMWVYLAVSGLDLPRWCLWVELAAYVGVLGIMGVRSSRKSRVRLHRSRYTWRVTAVIIAAAALGGASVAVTARLVEWARLPFGSLVQATLCAGFFLLVTAPANRWAFAPMRSYDGSRR
ncbi:hypothetical protein A6A06_15900 [Streptomyces sp. CB02923]|uniref:hypothetical protein n=1 Tax=Streptomyces sp. CB02923 TaxID=1718985 RepID=UPI00093ED85A|nr:hypothetical protein [Streptomyces sp. CB02923]OKI02715.1 hypothetical protein A6A06_15900 [Streptomyces sp. CB02923]